MLARKTVESRFRREKNAAKGPDLRARRKRSEEPYLLANFQLLTMGSKAERQIP